MVDAQLLKARVDLLELIKQDTELRKVAGTRGGEYSGPCPFCGGRDRLRVQPEEGLWWCRSCGGDHWQDAIAYVQQRDGCGFLDACKILGGHVQVAAPSTPQLRRRQNAVPSVESAEPCPAWRSAGLAFLSECEAVLWSSAGEQARAYLLARGLKDDTLRAWRIGFQAIDAWSDPARWGLNTAGTGGKKIWLPRGIVLPWLAKGQLWQIKVRRADGNPKYVAVKGGDPLLFGADTLSGHHTAVLTEGEFDVMLLHQEVGDLVGAATLGSASKGMGSQAIDYLLPVPRLLVAYDTDGEGEKGAGRLAGFSARMRRVRPPSGKDVTEFWQLGGHIRAWVEYELARINAQSATPLILPQPGLKPMPHAATHGPVLAVASPLPTLRAQYPFEAKWGRDKGWLQLRDPFSGRWEHDVWARDCPRGWIEAARAQKVRLPWSG